MLPPGHCFGSGMMMLCFAECTSSYRRIECPSCKICTLSGRIFFGSPYSAKISLTIFTRLSADRLFPFFVIGRFAVVIYNTQKSFTINHDNVCTNHFQWSAWYFIMHCSFSGLHSWELQGCGTLLGCVFYVSTHIDPLH